MKTVIKRYERSVTDWMEKLLQKNLDMVTVEEMWEFYLEMMTDSYLEGYSRVGASLKDDVDRLPDQYEIERAISQKVADKTTEDRVTEYTLDKDMEKLKSVLLTEYHRLYSIGSRHRAVEVDDSLEEGYTVMKRWVTEDDGAVRATHHYLHGVTLPIDGIFVALDGDEAEEPGLFVTAENNCNCRCALEYFIVPSARVDEYINYEPTEGTV